MGSLNPLNAYKETNIKTASQGKLVLMLYSGAIKQLDLASANLSSKTPKLDEISNAIIKAQDIITELMVSLDFEKGGEISQNLYSLYIYFNRQLMQANVKKDKELITPVLNMLKELKEAWEEVFKKAGTGSQRDSVGVNIAG